MTGPHYRHASTTSQPKFKLKIQTQHSKKNSKLTKNRFKLTETTCTPAKEMTVRRTQSSRYDWALGQRLNNWKG
jgi:hypothetical protein